MNNTFFGGYGSCLPYCIDVNPHWDCTVLWRNSLFFSLMPYRSAKSPLGRRSHIQAWDLPIQIERFRERTELVQRSAYRGSSHR